MMPMHNRSKTKAPSEFFYTKSGILALDPVSFVKGDDLWWEMMEGIKIEGSWYCSIVDLKNFKVDCKINMGCLNCDYHYKRFEKFRLKCKMDNLID